MQQSSKTILFYILLVWGIQSSTSQDKQTLPPQCYEKDQSPINIKTEDIIVKNYPKVRCTDYLLPFQIEVTNNGYAPYFELVNPKKIPTISKGPLNATYIFQRGYFHWQSEHPINGKHSPLEVHLFHYNEKYDSLADAQNYPDGIVAVAIITKVSKENKAVSAVLEAYPTIETQLNKPVTVKEKLVLRDLLPEDFTPFYFYNGRVPIETCYRIYWLILQNYGHISAEQLKILTSIRDKNNQTVTSNIRETQPLDGRHIYANIKN